MNVNQNVLILGGLLVDKYFLTTELPMLGQDTEIHKYFDRVGGCSINVAITLKNLGCNPYIVSGVGNDKKGQIIKDYLFEQNLNTEFITYEENASGFCLVLLDQNSERTFLTYKGCEEHLDKDILSNPLIHDMAYVYVTGYYVQDLACKDIKLKLLRILKDNGSKIIFDPGPMVDIMDCDFLKDILSLSDITTPNKKEVEWISQKLNIEDFVEWCFGQGLELIVIKDGGHELKAYTKSKQYAMTPYQVHTVDTTGAGDSFAGGLVYALISGLDLEDVLKFASACGAYTTTILEPHGNFSIRDIIEIMERNNNMQDRAYGCLIGAAIGDAMGMPASFMTPSQIKRIYGKITDFLKPKEEQVAHGNLEEAEITDDTEEALIISSVLIEGKGFDEGLFIEKMKKWAIENKMLESTVIGPSTRSFLEAIIEGRDYYEKGKLGDTNGGAMRVAPIGIYNHGNIEKTIQDAIASARPSHGSKPGVASTSAIAAAISLAIEGNATVSDIMNAAYKGALEGEKAGYDIPGPLVSSRIKLAKELVDVNKEKSLEEICVILYEYIGAGMKSYESIPLSLGIFYAANGDFENGIISTINIGDDADTNGAIVGALCGAFSGAKKINTAWIKKVKESNNIDFERIANTLLQ